jgi:hypothetical protein
VRLHNHQSLPVPSPSGKTASLGKKMEEKQTFLYEENQGRKS